MRARLYAPRSSDAVALDKLLDLERARNVNLDRDRIIVASNRGLYPAGALVWRPCGFLHDFACGSSLAQRTIANALVNYAFGDVQGRSFQVNDALFLVDPSNDAMLRFVRELPGAVEQSGVLFTIDLNPKPLPGGPHESDGYVRE